MVLLKKRSWRCLFILAVLLGSVLVTVPSARAAGKLQQKIPLSALSGSPEGAAALKLAGKWNAAHMATAHVSPQCAIDPQGNCISPNAYSLDPNRSSDVQEPLPSGQDANHVSYYDHDFYYLCGPGAVTVALSYWSNVNTALGRPTITIPGNGLTLNWDDAYRHAYVMYVAAQALAPGFSPPGLMFWYPSSPVGTQVVNLAEELNWEASGRDSSKYSNYFYLVVWAANLNEAKLNQDIVNDIAIYHHPAVVFVNDNVLPDWSGSSARGGSHYVAITGYDNNAGTYTYDETCDPQACGTSSIGSYTVLQHALFTGIQMNSDGGALIW